jgi:AraC family transcriptional regulator, regulatory protein of adaptative response / methylated-DNA-[protein]-cysteine methyltransferase
MTGRRATSGTPASVGAGIAYAIGASSLGEVLVAEGDHGLRALLLGDDRDRLERDLAGLFPGETLAADAAGLADRLAAAVALVDEPWRAFELPLDIRGTEFQRRVWRELLDIPPGVTVSYADVARRIGAPSALRAVAGACAANMLAIVIPCHRVLRSNGSLSGYRWGLERKRQLIERERARL